MHRKNIVILIVFAMMLAIMAGCSSGSTSPSPDQGKTPADPELILATTTSTQDSGLLEAILPVFEKETGYKVKVVAVGTGDAIKMGEQGNADVLLVHSPKQEKAFVDSGYGVNYKSNIFYNDFIIIGPAADPAGIKGSTDAVAAFTKIAGSSSVFISRGDNSGTHTKEKGIWEKAVITPAGNKWYIEAGQGMGETFRMADEKQAYTLIDRATFLANKDKYKLVVLCEGDKNLFNPYGVIAVNPEKYSNINKDGAAAFIAWITRADTQKLIGEFGKDKYGQALFVPTAAQ